MMRNGVARLLFGLTFAAIDVKSTTTADRRCILRSTRFRAGKGRSDVIDESISDCLIETVISNSARPVVSSPVPDGNVAARLRVVASLAPSAIAIAEPTGRATAVSGNPTDYALTTFRKTWTRRSEAHRPRSGSLGRPAGNENGDVGAVQRAVYRIGVRAY